MKKTSSSEAPAKPTTTPKRAPRKRNPAKAAAARPTPVRLSEADVANARATARPWHRTERYATSDFFVHAKFGVGYVTEITEQGYIVCLFEDGDTRKLVHAQA